MPTNTKPTSSKKSATARANGAKSHGPTTAAGRARSSRNATRHGLSATKSLRSLPAEPKGDRALRHGLAAGAEFTRGAVRRRAALPPMSVVLGEESPADFQRLLNSYLDEFAPTSPIEVELVETMASARWRLRRLANIETTLLYNEIETSVDDIDRFFEDVDREPDPEDHLAYAFKRLADGASLHLLNRYEGTINRSYAQAFKQLHLLRSLRIRVQPNEPKRALQSSPVKSLPMQPPASAPPPVLQTPPQPRQLSSPVEPIGDREPHQNSAPSVPTCDNGASPRINDQHLHS